MVHASKSLTYGKDTKRIIHVAEVVDRVSEDIMLQFAFVSISKTNSCSWLLVQYFLQTLVVERKKKSDAFVIGGWTSWVMQIMVCSILSSILFLYTEPEIMEMIVCQFWARL